MSRSRKTSPEALNAPLERLRSRDPAAAQLLGLSAFLGEARVPGWLVASGRDVLPDPLAASLSGAADAAIERARSLGREGLASVDEDGFRLSEGVARAIRERMSTRERASFGAAAVSLLHRSFPERVGRDRDAARVRALAPHVRAAAGHPSGGGRATSEAAHTLARLAAHHREAGRLAEAAEVLEQGVGVAHRGSGVEVALRAVLLDELAGARAGLEDREGALEAADRAVKIVPELPSGSPHRPMLLSNLATTFREVGAPGRAIGAYDQALEAVEMEESKSARPIEIELLLGRADAELTAGDARKAARTAARAVELAEAHVGEVHAFTVRALWLRADALREVGEPERATPLYRRSLVAEGQLLGPEHPSVGQKLMALGLHLSELGRPEAARDHLRGARDVFERALGPEADATRAAIRALDHLGIDGEG